MRSRIPVLLKDWIGYNNRVGQDGGTQKRPDLIRDYMLMAKQSGIWDSIEFGMLVDGGSKLRTSGVNQYVTKLHTFGKTVNDASQTTSTSQPFLSGTIAPNERGALKNPNGGANYMTHPTISFAANEGWSVTTALNWSGTNLNGASIFGKQGEGEFKLRTAAPSLFNIFRFLNSLGTAINGTIDPSFYIGKKSIYTVTANGNNLLNIYVNGVFIESLSIATNININSFFLGRNIVNTEAINGSISSHLIRRQALTPAQVAAEASFLRNVYPEIPSVRIGDKVWQTSNCEMVANTAGTLITDGNLQATWASGAAAYWCHHTDITTGATYGKLYNKLGRDTIIASPPDGWHVATEAELTTLSALGGYTLKKEGTNYWNTANGTNASGFTAIGSSSRNADGTFNTIKETASFWCADSDKVLKLYHDSNTAEIVSATANEGHSIRLVKN